MKIKQPTVPELIRLAKAYYSIPENRAGGSLHIVLDDGNIDDDDIRHCLDYARAEGDCAGVSLAEQLLKVSKNQRRKLFRRYWEYGH